MGFVICSNWGCVGKHLWPKTNYVPTSTMHLLQLSLIWCSIPFTTLLPNSNWSWVWQEADLFTYHLPFRGWWCYLGWVVEGFGLLTHSPTSLAAILEVLSTLWIPQWLHILTEGVHCPKTNLLQHFWIPQLPGTGIVLHTLEGRTFHYRLGALVYYGSNHFTSWILLGNGSVWSYDGMVNGGLMNMDTTVEFSNTTIPTHMKELEGRILSNFLYVSSPPPLLVNPWQNLLVSHFFGKGQFPNSPILHPFKATISNTMVWSALPFSPNSPSYLTSQCLCQASSFKRAKQGGIGFLSPIHIYSLTMGLEVCILLSVALLLNAKTLSPVDHNGLFPGAAFGGTHCCDSTHDWMWVAFLYGLTGKWHYFCKLVVKVSPFPTPPKQLIPQTHSPEDINLWLPLCSLPCMTSPV